MQKNFLRLTLLMIASLFLTNCTSVEQFNKKLEQPIPAEKLQKDIDYTQRKLERYYPNLYGYISKEQLNYKFDSIRKVVSKPMTSKEFYFAISPVIASVRQGHMSMIPVSKRVSKKEAKRLKKSGDGPLSQFVFEWKAEKLYVVKSKSKKNKIEEGTEVVSVNETTPQHLFSKYRKSFTSDGFNSTFIRKSFGKRFSLFMTNEIGINDSLTYVFKKKDSLFTKVVSRNKPIVKTAVVKDSAKIIAKTDVDKAKLKKEKKLKRIYGFDATSKEYIKTLKVVPSDSSVAVLKIKNFSQGRYYRVYDEFFDSIKKMNIKTLVIDIRDNPGGRVSDAVELYSYLTDKEYTILQPAEVTSKTSMWKWGAFRSAPKLAYPFLAAAYPIYMGFSYFKTTKNEDGKYYYKLVGSRPQKNSPNYFSGKVYVLINGGSFSAACIVASSLDSHPNVTFVGEETGGAYNGTVAGVMPVVTLPNSKISLRLGLMNIKTINQTDLDGRGIFPDKEIIPTLEDKISNKDPELEWILEDIKSKKQ